MIVAEQTTKDLKLYRCKECPGMNFYDLRELRLHVKNHLKKSWPLPKTHPYICPECFYEAATYLSLFKHVGTTHGAELKSKCNYVGFFEKKLVKSKYFCHVFSTLYASKSSICLLFP